MNDLWREGKARWSLSTERAGATVSPVDLALKFFLDWRQLEVFPNANWPPGNLVNPLAHQRLHASRFIVENPPGCFLVTVRSEFVVVRSNSVRFMLPCVG
jgi:hypothetical protein